MVGCKNRTPLATGHQLHPDQVTLRWTSLSKVQNYSRVTENSQSTSPTTSISSNPSISPKDYSTVTKCSQPKDPTTDLQQVYQPANQPVYQSTYNKTQRVEVSIKLNTTQQRTEMMIFIFIQKYCTSQTLTVHLEV